MKQKPFPGWDEIATTKFSRRRERTPLQRQRDTMQMRENRRKRRLRDPEWAEEQLAKLRAYRTTHKRLGSRKRRERVIDGNVLTEAQWQLILEYFGHQCTYCDTEQELQRDHVVPYSKGGKLVLGNIVPACPGCNGYAGKHDKDMRGWLNDEQRYEFIVSTMGDIEYADA